MSEPTCPDCNGPVSVHALYPDGLCPVVVVRGPAARPARLRCPQCPQSWVLHAPLNKQAVLRALRAHADEKGHFSTFDLDRVVEALAVALEGEGPGSAEAPNRAP